MLFLKVRREMRLSMKLKKNTKIVTFTESYRRETYVAFAEDKTEDYVFGKFLVWIFNYSNTFSRYYGLNKDFQTQINADFKSFLISDKSSKWLEYQSDDYDIQIVAHFYREDKDFLPTDLNKGHRSASISVALEIDIPSLHDGDILHEILAHLTYSMSITDLEDVRFLIDY